jgi:hypothetical protein
MVGINVFKFNEVDRMDHILKTINLSLLSRQSMYLFGSFQLPIVIDKKFNIIWLSHLDES